MSEHGPYNEWCRVTGCPLKAVDCDDCRVAVAEQMTPKMRAALVALAADGRSLSPNEIGYGMRAAGVDVPKRMSRQGRSMGPGSMIVPVLKALERRRWIAWGSRRDGLTGTAYCITDDGRAALRMTA